MSLQIQYSKTIAKELGKVAVYLPGEKINVGDIIQFPNGKGIFKIAPFGSFKKITDLKNLNIRCDIVSDSESADSYQFTSENVVEIDTNLGGTAATKLESLPKGNAKVQLSFSKKGSLLFHALECTKQSLNNIQNLESEINDNGKQLLWDDTYLVTAVTTATKALVVQSTSKNFQLELGGDIKNVQSGILQLDAAANIKVTKKKGSAFIKEWSNNVTVFVDVMRFRKKIFQKGDFLDDDALFVDNDPSESRIKLEPIDLKQYLNE